jgi:hypothetical protein
MSSQGWRLKLKNARISRWALRKSGQMSGMVAHAWNPSTQEEETRGSQVLAQPSLYSKTLSQNNNKNVRIWRIKWKPSLMDAVEE